MRLTNILILLFILAAFTIGVSLNEADLVKVDGAIDNATNTINEINLTYIETNSSIPNMKGIYLVLEKYIHFIGTFALETMRAGITFGYDNPDYFEPEFIIYTIKLIVIAVIISLLIKPIFYLIIFLIMCVVYISDKIKKSRREKRQEY